MSHGTSDDEEVSKIFYEDPKLFYQTVYIEAYRLAIAAISERFEQPDFQIYISMEQILIGSLSNKNIDSDINAVVGTFEGDINEVKLRSQLDTWRVLCDGRKIANYMDAKTIVSEHAGADVLLSEVSHFGYFFNFCFKTFLIQCL